MYPAQVAPIPWFRRMPRIGSAEEFVALRRLLTGSHFAEAEICGRLGVDRITTFSSPPPAGRTMDDSLDALIALFFDCTFVEEARLAALLPAGAPALFESLGLISRDSAPPGSVYATTAILPVKGVLSLCDRAAAPDGSDCELPTDVVFPAISETSGDFLNEMPGGPCDALLDLGTGSGVAALLGAREAGHVWATDVTARAVRFADFSRRLAGLDNITVLEGDLYAPVEGLTFDRILIHPPYVPLRADRPQLVCADAGDDGESIVRRTISGLPLYLRPGGRFYSLQMTGDGEENSLEARIRRWLGPAEQEFDMVVALHPIRTKLEFHAGGRSGVVALEGTRYHLGLAGSSRDECLIHAGVLLERHRAPAATVTHRIREGNASTGRDLHRQLEWQKALLRPDSFELLMSSRPAAPPDMELHTVSRLHQKRFRPAGYRVEVPGSSASELHCEEWMTNLLPACDGTVTWRAHLERLKNEGHIRPDVPERSFADLLGLLVSKGILTIAG